MIPRVNRTNIQNLLFFSLTPSGLPTDPVGSRKPRSLLVGSIYTSVPEGRDQGGDRHGGTDQRGNTYSFCTCDQGYVYMWGGDTQTFIKIRGDLSKTEA